VQDRHLEVIDLHEGIIDSHAIEHAQKVLRGRDKHALAHQAGGVAHARHVLPTCRNREITEIGSQKNDASGGRGRKDADGDRDAAVESDARGFNGTLNSRLESQAVSLAIPNPQTKGFLFCEMVLEGVSQTPHSAALVWCKYLFAVSGL